MSKVVAILQSNYIPWKGYFDIINKVDEFILYDDVQYTKRDWRNRNLIKTQQGLHWLTIPVETKGKYNQTIWETQITEPYWAKKHWETIKRAYSKSPFFEIHLDTLNAFFLKEASEIKQLSALNRRLIEMVNKMLNISTPLSWSHEYDTPGEKSDKLLGICLKAGATHYLSGPAAKCYLDEKLFNDHNIEVLWMDYSGYPEYNQSFPPFEHGVSILDLIFNQGNNAKSFMKSFIIEKTS
ncbi:MAG: WbqC family protein [Alphaproteobacteria bacterium]|nr:WbqC family protein [Alphaproteobacteria bacterium]